MSAIIDNDGRAVHCTIEGSIGWLRIDNPKRMNALSISMAVALADGVSHLAADEAVRVIIIAGAGNKAFCAGGDLDEIVSSGGAAGSTDFASVLGRAVESIQRAHKPTIAMIHGHCVGGGVSIATACNLRIAANESSLSIPIAKRGLAHDVAGLQRLVQLIGPSRTRLMLYTGRKFGAAEAYAIGLVDEHVPAIELQDHTISLAQSIAANAPLSIYATRVAIDYLLADPIDRNLDACERAIEACLISEDLAESARASLDKRPPVFKGR